jgi:hypothetical protein
VADPSGAAGARVSLLARLDPALRLETGLRQLPALYERFGFYRIAGWGSHAADPTSVCFDYQLARP